MWNRRKFLELMRVYKKTGESLTEDILDCENIILEYLILEDYCMAITQI